MHPSLSRESCIDCHAPIAAEWRESFHFLSVTGPLWTRIRAKRFDVLFDLLRVPCMNCHAPANVLDLPEGAYPDERSDQPQLGVDCVACHVSRGGILGTGRRTAPHDVAGDERFRDPAVASTRLCARCHDEPSDHARTVTQWRRTELARRGVTCLDCHMPPVEAPSVTGGPARPRRSHRFFGDKEVEMLRRALNATIRITPEREAVVTIVNDRVGHSLPASGTNWLLVRVTVRDGMGRVLEETERGFGTREWLPGYLDFWPFVHVSKIPYGETRDVVVDLPRGRGTVLAEFRYRDWFAVKDRDLVLDTIVTAY